MRRPISRPPTKAAAAAVGAGFSCAVARTRPDADLARSGLDSRARPTMSARFSFRTMTDAGHLPLGARLDVGLLRQRGDGLAEVLARALDLRPEVRRVDRRARRARRSGADCARVFTQRPSSLVVAPRCIATGGVACVCELCAAQSSGPNDLEGLGHRRRGLRGGGIADRRCVSPRYRLPGAASAEACRAAEPPAPAPVVQRRRGGRRVGDTSSSPSLRTCAQT
jgi:hypothetical protein